MNLDTHSLEYYVNIEYHQTPVVGQGLHLKVFTAQEAVLKTPYLVRDDKTRDVFLRQNPKKVSRYLCTTVIPYLYLLQMKKIEIPFDKFYLNAINDKHIGPDRATLWINRTLCWVTDEAAFMSRYGCREYWELSHHNLSTDEMIKKFIESNKEFAIVRTGNKYKSKHTYLLRNISGCAVMYDTYHRKWTSKQIDSRHPKKEKLYYIYGYL